MGFTLFGVEFFSQLNLCGKFFMFFVGLVNLSFSVCGIWTVFFRVSFTDCNNVANNDYYFYLYLSKGFCSSTHNDRLYGPYANCKNWDEYNDNDIYGTEQAANSFQVAFSLCIIIFILHIIYTCLSIMEFYYFPENSKVEIGLRILESGLNFVCFILYIVMFAKLRDNAFFNSQNYGNLSEVCQNYATYPWSGYSSSTSSMVFSLVNSISNAYPVYFCRKQKMADEEIYLMNKDKDKQNATNDDDNIAIELRSRE